MEPQITTPDKILDSPITIINNSAAGGIASRKKCLRSQLQEICTLFCSKTHRQPPFLWMKGQKPTPQEQQEILSLTKQALKELDRPADAKDISLAFALLSAGLKVSTNQDENATALAYKRALEDIGYWALQKATEDVLRGKAIGLSATFMPATSEFVLYCGQLENNCRV
ncbi:hypothetical protein [Bartonella sp. DGB2]|uniref:hypothetical protein n=1 Tax=Bartonella sp. DGB2 TaxID=3388426 RepID=UPI0039901AC1